MKGVGAPHGDQQSRYDHGYHGEGDIEKSHEAECPHQGDADSGKWNQCPPQSAEAEEQDQKDDQHGEEGKDLEVILSVFRECVANDRIDDLIELERVA